MTMTGCRWALCVVLFVGLGLLPSRFDTLSWAEEVANNNSPSATPNDTHEMAAEEHGQAVEASRAFVELARKARASIVTVTFQGRDEQDLGLGTGFVIDKSGLIATNKHVIGEARPIQVRFFDGSEAAVESVYATDQHADLAILKIDPAQTAIKDWVSLPLGTDEDLEQGTIVAAIGHPNGLKNTLVSGLVSGYQEINSRQLIQVAMPIDHGNSGGPLLNQAGEVIGVITYKSATTPNIGFAMPVKELKQLVKTPNPISLARWVTIGLLDANHWQPLLGANWRQRAGRIQVSGTGSGFGGRSLCLNLKPVKDPQKFEVAVMVKLEDEAGAAGLVFQADEKNRHYGFYPSSGKLRLSRFDGPDVFHWQVLREFRSEAYHPGEWNRLKVSVEGEQIRCYCNEELVAEVQDATYRSGVVGLAKFRDTTASFKEFAAAPQLPAYQLEPDLEQKLQQRLAEIETELLTDQEVISELSGFPETLEHSLEATARELELRAAELRALGRHTHEYRMTEQIEQELKQERVDLAKAALLLARFDNPEVRVEDYQEVLLRAERELQMMVAEETDEQKKREILDRYLFQENGFHGSRSNYYHKSNSYFNEVLDDREGLPVTLSVLYMALGDSIGLDLRGIGLPGHFVVRQYVEGQPGLLIDVFSQGETIDLSNSFTRLQLETQEVWSESDLEPQSPRQILVRMVRNLKGLAESQEDYDDVLRYLNLLAKIDPQHEIEHRYLRALILIRDRQKAWAEKEVNWLSAHAVEELGEDRLMEIQRFADYWLNNSSAED